MKGSGFTCVACKASWQIGYIWGCCPLKLAWARKFIRSYSKLRNTPHVQCRGHFRWLWIAAEISSSHCSEAFLQKQKFWLLSRHQFAYSAQWVMCFPMVGGRNQPGQWKPTTVTHCLACCCPYQALQQIDSAVLTHGQAGTSLKLSWVAKVL